MRGVRSHSEEPRWSQPTWTTPPSVSRAFEGAYSAYCVTNFWEHFSPETEKAQARAMAEAAKETGAEARDLVHAGRHAKVRAALR